MASFFMLTLYSGKKSLKYKWYRAEGKLVRQYINRTIDFGFWIGAKDEKQARQRIERNFKKRRYNFILETLKEDTGPPGN